MFQPSAKTSTKFYERKKRRSPKEKKAGRLMFVRSQIKKEKACEKDVFSKNWNGISSKRTFVLIQKHQLTDGISGAFFFIW